MKTHKRQKLLYVLIIIFCVGFYLYNTYVNGDNSSYNLMRLILLIAICVTGILRTGQPRHKSLSFYEKSYNKELRSAFADDKKSRRQLIKAFRLYNEMNFPKAIKILADLKSKRQQPDDYFSVGLCLALCLTDIQLYDDALNEYEELLSRQLETSTIYNNIGHIHARLGKKQEAIKYYQRSLTLSPDNAFAHVNIANMYFEENDFNMAIPYAKKALNINSKLQQASNLLAIIYALKKDKENADRYFHMAISNGSNPRELKNAIQYYQNSR